MQVASRPRKKRKRVFQDVATIETTPVPVHTITRECPGEPAPVVPYPPQTSDARSTFAAPSMFEAATREDVLWQLRMQMRVQLREDV
eukprot:1625259-Amphidinium_carterae.1